MKKTLITMTMMASFGMASTVMAADLTVGAATMQWAGSVPPKTVSGEGYWIVQDGAIGLTDGVLTFSNSDKGVALKSSSEIGFKVVKDEGIAKTFEDGIDIKPLGYNYTLVNVKVGINGLAVAQADGGYFEVHADGATAATPVGTVVETNKTAAKPTRLSIKAKDGAIAPDTLLKTGDDVVLMAELAIAPFDAAI